MSNQSKKVKVVALYSYKSRKILKRETVALEEAQNGSDLYSAEKGGKEFSFFEATTVEGLIKNYIGIVEHGGFPIQRARANLPQIVQNLFVVQKSFFERVTAFGNSLHLSFSFQNVDAMASLIPQGKQLLSSLFVSANSDVWKQANCDKQVELKNFLVSDEICDIGVESISLVQLLEELSSNCVFDINHLNPEKINPDYIGKFIIFNNGVTFQLAQNSSGCFFLIVMFVAQKHTAISKQNLHRLYQLTYRVENLAADLTLVLTHFEVLSDFIPVFKSDMMAVVPPGLLITAFSSDLTVYGLVED